MSGKNQGIIREFQFWNSVATPSMVPVDKGCPIPVLAAFLISECRDNLYGMKGVLYKYIIITLSLENVGCAVYYKYSPATEYLLNLYFT